MLADILGQDKLAENFLNAWRRGRLAQAYILSGPDGIGKTPFAAELAKTFLCREHGSDACEQCPSCRKANHGNHEDIEILEPETKGRVISRDAVHALIEALRFKARSGEHRFVIIREADRLQEAAANHFLKTLEEPPTDVTFFLLTARLPALVQTAETIVSRCQIVRMHRAASAEIEGFLLDRGFAPEKARLYASLSDGCPGRAANMEEAGVFERRERVLHRLLAVDRDNAIMAATEMLAANKGKTTTQTRENHCADLGLMAVLLRDMTLIAEGADNSLLYNPDVAGKMKQRALASRAELLRRHTLHALETRNNIERFINPELAISRLFLELCN